ncbi:hypothetical protein NC661_11755 [Aquibacillus koreensis]|uniref:Uncharacterized protein n=1 Tax=Aquibacillus koreensis TaxID=279446 RepID=A0A9X4AK53_9BACI|nr:hypothetical protein [Aquibacillus koreensis]MCT2535184.1 hypothetical protein [Aquibacillus koreensis]MDC3421043.1 hypothetical protein [Aquibacillus koreensis]
MKKSLLSMFLFILILMLAGCIEEGEESSSLADELSGEGQTEEPANEEPVEEEPEEEPEEDATPKKDKSEVLEQLPTEFPLPESHNMLDATETELNGSKAIKISFSFSSDAEEYLEASKQFAEDNGYEVVPDEGGKMRYSAEGDGGGYTVSIDQMGINIAAVTLTVAE